MTPETGGNAQVQRGETGMRRWIAIAVLLAMTMTLCACGMSAEKQAEMERETLDMLKDVNVGDEVRFGVYDGEPIEWVVAV